MTARDVVRDSPHLHALAPDLRRAAATDVPVLISGEAGVGKEWVARVIHAESRRGSHGFHPVECHQPAGPVEADLAKRMAGPGAVYLRDIDALDSVLQERVAKVLESKAPHARVIASTRNDLHALVAAEAFSAALFYRLNVFHLLVPPLREHRDAVPTLARGFLRTGKDALVLEPAAAKALMAYRWPANIRELEAVAARLTALGRPSVSAADVETALAESAHSS